MNIYPAMRAKMGRWHYYVVKMSMRELADNVKFAADVYDDRTLDDAIQRVLDESRVKSSIVTYLVRQPDRFFSSIVVAAMRGNPKWYPVTMEDDERFDLFKDDPRLNETFGVLRFDGTQDYYALDGQHRLKAIKALIDPDSDVSADAPEGFKDEEISVIVVVPVEAETEQEFLQRYRRLFGNLNRYAKPMDQVTNIIMDEDDVFAIITRYLITQHSFFKYSGRQKDSQRVKTKKGKNLRSADPYFTSLETLYSVNIKLLSTQQREQRGWNDQGEDSKQFARFRPSEEVIDALYDELRMYWDALLESLPVLYSTPSEMRDHTSGMSDNILFWPIGQEILAELSRELLNVKQEDPESPTEASIRRALQPLSKVNWEFRMVPWRNVLLIQDSPGAAEWRIRSEDRKTARGLCKRIVKWNIGLDKLDDNQIKELRAEWEGMLFPAMQRDEMDNMWREVETMGGSGE